MVLPDRFYLAINPNVDLKRDHRRWVLDTYRSLRPDHFERATTVKLLNLDQFKNYETFEHEGDACIYYAVTLYIGKVFPDMTLHERSTLRTEVVNNKALAQLCRTLDMPQYLKTNRPPTDGQIADLFESFVGAIGRQYGSAFAIEWTQFAMCEMVHEKNGVARELAAKCLGERRKHDQAIGPGEGRQRKKARYEEREQDALIVWRDAILPKQQIKTPCQQEASLPSHPESGDTQGPLSAATSPSSTAAPAVKRRHHNDAGEGELSRDDGESLPEPQVPSAQDGTAGPSLPPIPPKDGISNDHQKRSLLAAIAALGKRGAFRPIRNPPNRDPAFSHFSGFYIKSDSTQQISDAQLAVVGHGYSVRMAEVDAVHKAWKALSECQNGWFGVALDLAFPVTPLDNQPCLPSPAEQQIQQSAERSSKS